MTLSELIKVLEKANPDFVPKIGFSCPHSYRGDYNSLAFEPTKNVSVGEMLESAKNAVGQEYDGWKGGEFTMYPESKVYLAFVGCCGESLGSVLLAYMLEQTDKFIFE